MDTLVEIKIKSVFDILELSEKEYVNFEEAFSCEKEDFWASFNVHDYNYRYSLLFESGLVNAVYSKVYKAKYLKKMMQVIVLKFVLQTV